MGAMSIPEALRIVPGLHVARIDAGRWVVASRGWSGRFSNKLLVLIDGRSVYTPLFSGVYWEIHDIPMEDIERIEVIRGPGATMWGANAVNGVINVITKSAAATPRTLVSTVAGSLSGSMTTLRHGGSAGEGRYRAYAKYHNRLSSPDDDFPLAPEDGWRSMRGGLRYDQTLSQRDELTLHGELHSTEGGQRAFTAAPGNAAQLVSHQRIGGDSGFLLGRWTRSASESSELAVQSYYDATHVYEGGTYEVSLKTFDVEARHRFQHSGRGELTWGGGYRIASSEITPSELLHPQQVQRRTHYRNAFAQEEVQLRPDELYVTLGAKLEHNSLGGFALQPTARTLWRPNDRLSAWASISRAARSPSLGEQDVRFDVASTQLAGTVAVISLFPNPDLRNEILTAYETGVRFTPDKRFSFDVATFYNSYEDARQAAIGRPFFEGGSTTRLVIPMRFDNQAMVCTRGLEVATVWRAASWWRLTASHSALRIHESRPGAPSQTEALEVIEGRSPSHQTKVFSNWRLTRHVELDATAVRVGPITAAGFFRRGETFPAAVQADLRLGWRASERVRLSVGVQNLFDVERTEFEPESLSIASPVGRNVYGRVVWSF